jgi:hypothetical protein
VPATFTVGTPGGGRHLYFKGSLPSTVRKLGRGIDTRGVGGYVLIPPSIVHGKPYTVLHDIDPAPVPAWIVSVLAETMVERKPYDGPLDEPGNVARARRRLLDLVERNDVAISGQGGNSRTYQVATDMLSLGVSADKALALIDEIWNPHCQPPWDYDELQVLVDNADRYGQEPGRDAVRPAAETFAKAAGELGTDDPIDAAVSEAKDDKAYARFFVSGAFDRDEGGPNDVSEYLTDAPVELLQMLVEGWIERGIYVALSGPGGTHKSRLLLMLCLCMVFGRALFRQDGNTRQAKVDHVEYLSCENSTAETRRRIATMKATLNLKPEQAGATMKIWELRDSRRCLLVVDANLNEGKPKLTDFGKRMMLRWEKLAKSGKRLLLVFDSLFNVVDFRGASKNSDDCAKHVVQTLDHWCDIFNASILAPFHPSRAGVQRGDTGYSPVFDNAPRQVLAIKETIRREKGTRGQGYQTVPTGLYEFKIGKWNNGKQGRSVVLQFENGILNPAIDTATGRILGHSPGDVSEVEAAATVALMIAYGRDAEMIPMAGADERAAIELRHRGGPRLKRDGKVGPEFEVTRLTDDHWAVTEFRQLSGWSGATVANLLTACEVAVTRGLLAYRETSKTGPKMERGAGYGMPPVGMANEEAEEAGEEFEGWAAEPKAA